MAAADLETLHALQGDFSIVLSVKLKESYSFAACRASNLIILNVREQR